MKNQIKIIIIGLLTSTLASAAVDLKEHQGTISKIAAFESQGQMLQATVLAASAANEIAGQVGIDTVVAKVDNYFHEEREEVLTSSKKQRAGFGIPFAMIGGWAYRSWDAAKIITTNPDEVAEFKSQEVKSFSRLRSSLVSYFKDNELAIFYAKIFAAKALQLAGRGTPSEIQHLYPFVTNTALRLAKISFLGLQNIRSCITTNYANRTKEEGISIVGILSLHLSQSEEHPARSERSCSSNTNTLTVEESEIISGKLFTADLALKTEAKIFSFRQMMGAETPDYPTWGSPYYPAP